MSYHLSSTESFKRELWARISIALSVRLWSLRDAASSWPAMALAELRGWVVAHPNRAAFLATANAAPVDAVDDDEFWARLARRWGVAPQLGRSGDTAMFFARKLGVHVEMVVRGLRSGEIDGPLGRVLLGDLEATQRSWLAAARLGATETSLVQRPAGSITEPLVAVKRPTAPAVS